MAGQLANQRHLFDIPRDVAYFNCAYLAPLLHTAIEAGQRGISVRSRPWQITSDHFFDDVEHGRSLFARLIGADPDGVALIPSTSYGLSCAARNIFAGNDENVVVLAEQFPSNVYVWREVEKRNGATVRPVARPRDENWTRALLAEIDERTAVVAVPNCHWTDGGLVDLCAVGKRCREVKALLVLDLTQSLGAMRFDVASVQPDYIVCAGYKWLLGPYSVGFLWMAPEHRDGNPIEFSWMARERSNKFSRLVEYRDTYRQGARRFDVGENSNFILIPMMNAALEQILSWEVGRIEATLGTLTTRIADRAAAIGLNCAEPGLRAGHFLGLRFPGEGPPEDLSARLAEEQIFVSVRGNSMRVTPHLHTTDEDVDRLFGALRRVGAGF